MITMSLERGRYYRLPETGYVSNNSNVLIFDDTIVATIDDLRPNGQAVLTKDGSDDIEVTIVPWSVTGRIKLEHQENAGGRIITAHNGYIYRHTGTNIYRTNDGFITQELVSSTAPEAHWDGRLFHVNNTWIITTNNAMYASEDLQEWVKIGDTTFSRLYHAADVYYDEPNDTIFAFCGEYTWSGTNNRHKVYRASKVGEGEWNWDIVLELFSQDEYAQDNSNIPHCRHIHVVAIDPYTGNIYVGTGDNGIENKIMLSEDFGETWREIGNGIQAWRTLSIWFTKRYIYWNMDSTAKEIIWRLDRLNLSTQTLENDQKEQVAVLDNGSHWYHIWAKDLVGDDVVFMAGSIEGARRDYNARVWMIKELADGRVKVDEVYIVPGTSESEPMMQLEPKLQGADGSIYFYGRSTPYEGMQKMKLKAQERQINHEFVSSYIFSTPLFTDSRQFISSVFY